MRETAFMSEMRFFWFLPTSKSDSRPKLKENARVAYTTPKGRRWPKASGHGNVDFSS